MTAILRLVLDQVVSPVDPDLAVASRELARALVATAPTGCGASAIVPAVEYAVTVGLVALVLLGLLVAGLRLLARWLRERREDREDEITAAAWRAAHARTAVP